MKLIRSAIAVDLVLAIMTILNAIAPMTGGDAPPFALAHELVVPAGSETLLFVFSSLAMVFAITFQLLGKTLTTGASEFITKALVGFWDNKESELITGNPVKEKGDRLFPSKQHIYRKASKQRMQARSKFPSQYFYYRISFLIWKKK